MLDDWTCGRPPDCCTGWPVWSLVWRWTRFLHALDKSLALLQEWCHSQHNTSAEHSIACHARAFEACISALSKVARSAHCSQDEHRHVKLVAAHTHLPSSRHVHSQLQRLGIVTCTSSVLTQGVATAAFAARSSSPGLSHSLLEPSQLQPGNAPRGRERQQPRCWAQLSS